MMIESFGQKLLKHFCAESLTVPALARAIGVHTSTLEKAMAENKPSTEIVDTLALLSTKNLWFYGIAEITSDAIWQWVVAWNQAAPENRTTVTLRTWDMNPAVRDRPDPNPGTDVNDWLRRNPVFTLDAWMETWNYGISDAVEALHAANWYCTQEWQSKVTNVWRWNPLKKKRKRGRPPEPYVFQERLPSPPDIYNCVSMRPATKSLHKGKLHKILATLRASGCNQVNIQEVALLFHGRKVSSSMSLQRVRDNMTACGWEYNMYDRVWRPRTSPLIISDQDRWSNWIQTWFDVGMQVLIKTW
jgi:hypothetical protein